MRRLCVSKLLFDTYTYPFRSQRGNMTTYSIYPHRNLLMLNIRYQLSNFLPEVCKVDSEPLFDKGLGMGDECDAFVTPHKLLIKVQPPTPTLLNPVQKATTAAAAC